jgi:predicted nucleotide-binding protein (sugar kinase/HSP70/actin superfamily)
MKLSTQEIESAANSEFSRFASRYGYEATEQIAELMRKKATAALEVRKSKESKNVIKN